MFFRTSERRSRLARFGTRKDTTCPYEMHQLTASISDLIVDRKRRLIGDEFYSRHAAALLSGLTSEEIEQLPTIGPSELSLFYGSQCHKQI